MNFFQLFLALVFLTFLLPSGTHGSYLTETQQLLAQGAGFTWEEAKSRSVQIQVEYRDQDGTRKRADLGSGFLISPDGLFVTAYHVMKYCLGNSEKEYRFSVALDCSSEHAALRYQAQNDGGQFEIELISHLTMEDSLKGNVQTPDEIIKRRDFVVGRIKGAPGLRFAHWPLSDFQNGTIDLAYPEADFELKPLLPPKRVFIAGYPSEDDFSIAHGFLNLTEERRRGYFAVDIPVYGSRYLETQGIPSDTRWGIGVKNHMSGGPVVDLSGNVVGVVVNGNEKTAGILSIENLLETFFSRSADPGDRPALVLGPRGTPLYLKKMPAAQDGANRYSYIRSFPSGKYPD
jgi:hypothetical protein